MGLKKLGRYDIIRIVGKGAMGMVYEARDPNLERRVAIKTIKVDALSQEASAEYEARFRTEAHSAARLQHPHIVSVYDSGRHGDMAYLVMEFVQGDDLKQLLDRGITFTLAQATHMMCDLLSALDYAHRQNIVHRDVKPANLLIEANGRVKLTDFGVARIQDAGDATRTRGSMVGTLKYMAPEQVQGLAVDARADIFAAGVLLYQLLTGRRPFDGESDFAIIQQIVASAPAAPSTLNAQLPPAIDAVVALALAPLREQRFASAQVFAVALEAAVATAADQTIVPPPGMRPAVEWGGTGANAKRGSGRSGGGNNSGLAARGDTSGSTVTQELELVYWKDVKDSDDLADLQGFLDRFPHGIYGDLARRRLKRLGGQERGEQTGTALQTRVMDRGGAHTGFADTEQMTDDTVHVERSPGSADSYAVSEDEQTLAVAPDRWTTDAESVESAPAGEAMPEVLGTQNASGHVHAKQPDGAEHRVASAARSQPVRRWAMVASLLVACVLTFWGYGTVTDSEPAQTSIPLGTPTAGEVAVGVVAATASESAAVPSSVAAADLPAEPSSAATSALQAAFAVRPAPTVAQDKPIGAKVIADAPKGAAATAATSTATSTTTSTTTSTERAAPEAPSPLALPGKSVKPRRTEPVAAVGGDSASPEKACEGRILLGYQTCMSDQCAKAEFAGRAVCRQRRMAEQARDLQHNNRN